MKNVFKLTKHVPWMTCLICLSVLVACPSWAATWDLAADFSYTANPNGPWTYGGVTETAGVPSISAFTLVQTGIWPGDFGPGQDQWSSGSHMGLMKGVGGAITVDLPAGRCAGHALTGCRWIAPKNASVKIVGDSWKLRNNDAAYITVWVKGVKIINNYHVPNQSGTCNSTTPYTFEQMITDQGGNPTLTL